MSDKPRILVVDDESVICHACQRVFAHQGFQVDESTDAREGLHRAMGQDYSGILLDIKMPEMDGIQFLEELRKQKPDLPVLIMTGYPSVPNAAAAVRLGASDYITKPFSPEQITQSVRRLLSRGEGNGSRKADVAAAPPESSYRPEGELFFLDESWLRPEVDGSACVGAVLSPAQAGGAQAVQLPNVGDVVYQGLPLAGLQKADQSLVVVRSPISGVIVSVNDSLVENPSLLLNDPCGKGWIACICTTRLEEEMGNCKPRRLILANGQEAAAEQQREGLKSLGCEIDIVGDEQQLLCAVEGPDCPVLLIDAESFGQRGPELVGRVNANAPALRVVVVASSGSRWEAEYRKRKVFYYAVAPFADNEIAEILNAAFAAQSRLGRQVERRKLASEPVSGIRVVNHNGHRVHLLAAPGLLQRHQGLGHLILRNLVEKSVPVTTTVGDYEVTPASVLKAAASCDRVMVLLAKDLGRLPGSLVRDTKAEYVSASRENAGRVTTLVVQPDPAGGLAGLDDRAMAAIGEHVVAEIVSY